LPGGVPDADDTAGALLALRKLGPADAEVLSAAEAGVRWLLDLQNRDGGMPTFCRGWGALPFDRSGADLTAHAVAAWSAWRPELDAKLHPRIDRAIRRSIDYLAANQCSDGAWAPLWFGNQRAVDDENLTYGTSRVLAALATLDDATHPRLSSMKRSASEWLLASQVADGSWGGDRDGGGSIEETALAVVALSAIAHSNSPSDPRHSTAIRRAAAWLIAQTDHGRRFDAAPIGLYFAKLWYFEELYPLIWSVAALRGAAS
jgi:squalene-hopene/tetraprenyl-beta-curcumene cyclase